jgi:hypothetical protein
MVTVSRSIPEGGEQRLRPCQYRLEICRSRLSGTSEKGGSVKEEMIRIFRVPAKPIKEEKIKL